MLKILDRYIIKRFLLTFFFILGLIMLIAMIFDISEQIDDFIKREAPLGAIIFKYYVNFVIFYGNLFSPLLTFLSVIFFTAQLANRTEIVAILSSGVSFRRLMRPYFISATILATMSFFLNNYLVPEANKQRIDFENQYMRGFRTNQDKNIHKQIRPGIMIYFDKFNTKRKIGYQFSLEAWDEGELESKIFAKYIRWDTVNEIWQLENFYIRKYLEDGTEHIRKGSKLDTALAFLPSEFQARIEDIQMLDVNELDDFIAEERLKGSSNITFYLIEKHSRNALPLSTYILTVIGVAMSSRKVRGGIGAHIAAGLALAVTYILAMKVSTVYATNAGLDPLIAVWIPNFLYGALAAYLYWKAPK